MTDDTFTAHPTFPGLIEAHARHTDPDTSHEAAASITAESIRVSQAAVLTVLRTFGPLHDEALVAKYERLAEQNLDIPRQSPSGIRTRRKELVDGGLAHATDERIRLPSGRKSIVWAAR